MVVVTHAKGSLTYGPGVAGTRSGRLRLSSTYFRYQPRRLAWWIRLVSWVGPGIALGLVDLRLGLVWPVAFETGLFAGGAASRMRRRHMQAAADH